MMNRWKHPKTAADLSPGFRLQDLISKLLQPSLPVAKQNGSTIVNSVSGKIYINLRKKKMIPVITELIETVAANSRNSRILISAERLRDIVTLRIQDLNNYNGYALGFSIQAMEPGITDAGAFIQFKDQRQKVATVSLSFTNPLMQ